MKMTRCPNNHRYDADKYDTCPFCSDSIKAGEEREKAPKKGKVVKVKVRAVKARQNAEDEAKAAEAQPTLKAESKTAEKKP